MTRTHQSSPSLKNSGSVRPTILENEAGMRVELLDLGATIRSIKVPTPDGRIETVLGFREKQDYQKNPFYLGSTIGRYANRLEDGLARIEGEDFRLVPTPGQLGHSLHGGSLGWSHLPWKTIPGENGQSVRFELFSESGDQGFPGNVHASVSYRLLDDWRLMISFNATTDQVTVLNMANHAYFNLNASSAAADNHLVFINADRYTPLKDNMIPRGDMAHVGGTPFDLRDAAPIAERLACRDSQLKLASGFDHNFVLNRVPGGTCLAGGLISPETDLQMKVYTTQPGLQFYCGQHLYEPFQPIGGICLEAQCFPNAPNQPGFPTAVLKPGSRYEHITLYEYSMSGRKGA